MSEEHWVPESDWDLIDEPGVGYVHPYRFNWRLTVRFDESAAAWRCVARAPGMADGYQEADIQRTSTEPWPAMLKSYEMADARA